MYQVNKEWFVFGVMALVVGVTTACTDASPTSPSNMSGVGSALNYSSSQNAIGAGSFSLSASDVLSGGGKEGSRKGKRRAKRAERRQFCESIPSGHEKYDRCQKFLKRGPGDGAKKNKGERRAKRAAKRAKIIQFCQSVPPGHEKHDRCQKLLERRAKRQG